MLQADAAMKNIKPSLKSRSQMLTLAACLRNWYPAATNSTRSKAIAIHARSMISIVVDGSMNQHERTIKEGGLEILRVNGRHRTSLNIVAPTTGDEEHSTPDKAPLCEGQHSQRDHDRHFSLPKNEPIQSIMRTEDRD